MDKLDREGLMRAIKARRTFAATDNVVVDFRMGEHFMGESFTARGAAPIKAFIQGTGPLASVTLVKNNRAIYSKPGEGPEMNFAYRMRTPRPVTPTTTFGCSRRTARLPGARLSG